MHIDLVTPYLPEVRNGNAHTAVRYARFLRRAGHRVDLTLSWVGGPVDALLALHARRVHASIAAFARDQPGKPLILVLTGTDLYRDIRTDADARRSLELATRLVVLQARGLDELAPALRAKTRVVYQSASAYAPRRRPSSHFDVCVAAHLRAEKDPFRAAEACRWLPPESRVRVWHVGGELEAGLAERARRLETEQIRWHWLGGLSHGQSRERIARAHLMVISSRLEGGANVICEAVMAGTPVLASDIPGNRGMLGEDYLGYFPAGDDRALAALMRRAEADSAFMNDLRRQCEARRSLFEPEREAAAVAALLA